MTSTQGIEVTTVHQAVMTNTSWLQIRLFVHLDNLYVLYERTTPVLFFVSDKKGHYSPVLEQLHVQQMHMISVNTNLNFRIK